MFQLGDWVSWEITVCENFALPAFGGNPAQTIKLTKRGVGTVVELGPGACYVAYMVSSTRVEHRWMENRTLRKVEI